MQKLQLVVILSVTLVAGAAWTIPARAQGADPAESMDLLGVAGQTAPAAAGEGSADSREAIKGGPSEWQDVPVDLTGEPTFNAGIRIVVMRNGKRESRTVSRATTDRLVDALQKIRHEGLQVVELELKGHGAPELQALGGGTFLTVAGKDVIVQKKDGKDLTITGLLAQTLAADAVVNLNGCKTGRGDDSVAQALSRALPGRTVSGGSLYQMGIPFTAKSWGTKRYFVNGRQSSKWWYTID